MAGNVLISGASSGIGAAIATLLVERGYRVFGTSRDPGKSSPIPGVEMIALDIRDQESVQRCVETVLDRAGSIDVMINNAGYALVGAVEESTDAEIADQFDVNFYGLVRLTRAVLPRMRERRRGHIINISSLAAGVAIPFMGFYSATKAAIEAYSEALLHEVTPFGIRVSVIEPPFIRTGLSDHSASAATPIAAYDGLRRSVTESIRHQVETGPRPTVVAKSVLGVLESKRPRFRNPVGSTGFVLWLRAWVPESAFFRVIRKRFKIDSASESRSELRYYKSANLSCVAFEPLPIANRSVFACR